MLESQHLTRAALRRTLAAMPDDLASWPGVQEVATNGSEAMLSVSTERLSDTMARLALQGITAITSHPPTLEELFLLCGCCCRGRTGKCGRGVLCMRMCYVPLLLLLAVLVVASFQ